MNIYQRRLFTLLLVMETKESSRRSNTTQRLSKTPTAKQKRQIPPNRTNSATRLAWAAAHRWPSRRSLWASIPLLTTCSRSWRRTRSGWAAASHGSITVSKARTSSRPTSTGKNRTSITPSTRIPSTRVLQIGPCDFRFVEVSFLLLFVFLFVTTILSDRCNVTLWKRRDTIISRTLS